MGLRINTNSSAVTALRNLRNADASQAKSLERLSTGLRINRAADDPSGLVISEQLRAQIGSLNQALENTENASNLIGTAEAALDEVSRLLVGMRESAIFALNTGGSSPEQVQAEQDSVNAAIDAIDRIAISTRFGSVQLLDGSQEMVITAQSNELLDINSRKVNFDGFTTRTFTVTVLTAAARASLDSALNNTDEAVSGGNVVFRISGSRGTSTITIGSGTTASTMMDAVNLVALNTGVTAVLSGTDLLYRSIDYGLEEYITLEQIGGSGTYNGTEAQHLQGLDASATINGLRASGKGNVISIDNTSFSFEIQVTASTTGTFDFTLNKSGMTFQLNTQATPNDSLTIGLKGIAAALLGSPEVSASAGSTTLTLGGALSTLMAGEKNDLETDAGNAVRIIDAAIDDVNDIRAFLGSIQHNILDSNMRSLGIATENLTASESAIRDLDFAAETSEFTRTQILFQAGTAVLASANLIPQTILSLLQ